MEENLTKFYEKTIFSEQKFHGRVIDVYVDTVETPVGTSTRELVKHPGGVCVAAVEDDAVYMVKQYRKGVEQALLELPAGKLEYGEDPLACGMRELGEEAGLLADEWISLGKIYPTPGFCSEIIYLYLAKGLHPCAQNLDDGEFLSVEKIPLDTLVEQIMHDEICDAKTVAGILKAKLYL